MRPSCRRRTEFAAVALAVVLSSATFLARPGAALGAKPAAPPAAGAAAPDPLAAYDHAMALYKDGAYADALAAYEAVYALKPLPEAMYGIARCHHQLAHYREAANAYEEFLAAAPTHSSAPKAREYLTSTLVYLGDEALKAGEYEVARRAYSRAVELRALSYPAATDDYSGRLLLGLGEALAGAGQRDRAMDTLRKALRAALPPEPHAKAESMLKDLEAGRTPAGLVPAVTGTMPPESAGTTGTAEPPELVKDPVVAPRKGGSKAALFAGVGIGGAVVAAGVVVLVVFLTRGEALPQGTLSPVVDWRR